MNNKISFRMISEENIKAAIEAGYNLLENVGVNINSDEALALLKDAGCLCDGTNVKIPRSIVKKAIDSAPSVFDVYNRLGEKAMEVGKRNCYFGPGPTCPNFFDPLTGERRGAIKQDAADTAKVADTLPNIDFVMSLCVIGSETKTLADVHEIHAMVQNTTKPLISWAFNKENLQDMVDMCAQVAGGADKLKEKPFLIVYCEPTTPLVHSKDALEKLMLLAKNRVPCIYTPGMIMGGTAPMTIAGALAVGLADSLTGLVISQLVNEGTPFIGGAPGGPMDMKTMQHSYGAPEWMLLHGASTEIFHYLDIPVFSAAGVSDSKVVDAQSAIESTMQILCAMGTAGNIVHDVGFMDLGMTGSIEQMVMCDEIIGMAKRLMRGVIFDEKHLALDVIKKVGPGGNFLMEGHTFEFFRENWMPTLIDRNAYGAWEKNGAKDMTARTQEKMRSLLAAHQPVPLDAETKNAIDAILAKAEQRANG